MAGDEERDDTITTPGEVVGHFSSLIPGRGTYLCHKNHRDIYASLTGHCKITPPSPTSTDKRSTIEIVGHKSHGAIPETGSIVIARVTKVMSKMASADIMCVGAKSVKEKFSGTIRQQDVRATEIDKVDMYASFHPGDIVRALVLSLGDSRAYFLSTAKNELGVVSAQSTSGSGDTMVPISWTEMQCPTTGQVEQRKVAKVV
ncbi:3-5 exoribonuclease CSL4 [Zostera marina]|uniref:3-5 exoribonuclease CSL4 n=1 Tax=Zostera marina TaxID=29655 RepID=A0A0K9PCA6_ZOSMR|nr:3-5 exoribonuclease CSL4 [Zostera marina]